MLFFIRTINWLCLRTHINQKLRQPNGMRGFINKFFLDASILSILSFITHLLPLMTRKLRNWSLFFVKKEVWKNWKYYSNSNILIRKCVRVITHLIFLLHPRDWLDWSHRRLMLLMYYGSLNDEILIKKSKTFISLSRGSWNCCCCCIGRMSNCILVDNENKQIFIISVSAFWQSFV